MLAAGLALGHVVNWLMFLNYLSYVKLGVTLVKYIPQVCARRDSGASQAFMTANAYWTAYLEKAK